MGQTTDGPTKATEDSGPRGLADRVSFWLLSKISTPGVGLVEEEGIGLNPIQCPTLVSFPEFVVVDLAKQRQGERLAEVFGNNPLGLEDPTVLALPVEGPELFQGHVRDLRAPWMVDLRFPSWTRESLWSWWCCSRSELQSLVRCRGW